MTDLADTLRRLREERGASLRQTAREAQMDPGYLSRIERGQKPATTETLERLAGYYDVDPDLMLLQAGKVPQDIVDILAHHPEAVEALRSRYARK